jgi:dipeptidyl aminopeptidase/acylaminoacyl peptidase
MRLPNLTLLVAITFSALNAFSVTDERNEFAPAPQITSETSPQEAPQARRTGGGGNNMYRATVDPQWFDDNTKFWYRNALSDGESEFILVDAEAESRERAFDHARLAEALSAASGQTFQGERLPFREIRFIEEGAAVLFEARGETWRYDLNDHTCAPFELEDENAETSDSGSGESASGSQRRGGGGQGGLVSPDGRWAAFVRNHNVHLRDRESDSTILLSDDGEAGNAYRNLEWSPDSSALIAWRMEDVERKQVHLIRSSPPGGGRATLESRNYFLPGDAFPKFEPNVFQVADRIAIKPEVDRFEHQWLSPRVRWNSDGRRFMYEQIDRGHQRLRVIEIDTANGDTRYLVDERTETFIWTHHTENVGVDRVTWLDSSDEFIYASEMEGWRHLYLVDIETAGMTPITHGEWVVRGMDRVDEENRQIWFTASGKNPDQDPYFIHYYRVDFDGSNFVALTESNGTHRISFSPDSRYLIATHSRVDSPPVNELRRTADGSLITVLEEADISELIENGWEAPEVFVAKGRDGETDIWGFIARPRDYDPAKKYPVIEAIYAGPQSSYTPKSFSTSRRYASLTDLGFVVVKLDGMGTANRSKAFHDVAWHNLKDAGFPDRILWMQAAAEQDPGMDLTRVGIYGNSAGGQNAAGALLFHPEFYKVGVASCGCHDNRMDKASWNEQWMGYPVGPQYSESSNIDNAHQLRGHLLLIVGELDTNVPPESTLRFADGLIRANKDFDLLVIPNGGHSMGGAYGNRRMQDFFVRHLMDEDPPNRNLE